MSGTVYGQANFTSGNSDFAANSFLVKQILAQISTATLAKVVSVTNAGGVAPVGFVSVLPLVNQTDGSGNAQPHVTVYNLPYFRLQGGSNAIILDPQVGDIGIVVFASRDISSVKASKAQANPGSKRKFSMADGLYIGGVLNGNPSQYVQFTQSGITITSPQTVTINANAITLNAANIAVNGATAMTGTLTSNGHDISSTHRHTASGGTGIGGVPV